MAFAGLLPPAQAQAVHVGATITGEVVPGMYGQVMLGNRPVYFVRSAEYEPGYQAHERHEHHDDDRGDHDRDHDRDR